MINRQKTAGIMTLGCKVNQYESEAIAEELERQGVRVLPPDRVCDAYVINTCTVTAESDRKARQFIRRAIHRNPQARILVTGCFSQTQPEAVAAIEGVDYVCGNAGKMAVVTELLRLFGEEEKPRKPLLSITAPDAMGFEPMEITRFDRTRAYVKIEDGCESRCTYCIIPDARGKIRSKPLESVVREVTALTLGGCREVVLTGIETASWGKDLEGRPDLADLLADVDRIPGIGRVRLGSLDPSLMKPSFVDRIKDLKSLAPHFHLSLQSGSDRILALMKRKYNRKMALAGIENLRKSIPDVMFTTDVIVGFPGETEEDFEQTLDFARRARFLMIHVFPYSKRKGTPAASMPGQIPEPVKHERLLRLSKLEAEIRKEMLDELTGSRVEVLFETFEDHAAAGHTGNFVEVEVPAKAGLHGTLGTVLIEGNDGTKCGGKLIPQ